MNFVQAKKAATDLNSYSVRYYTRAGAENAMRFINGTRLDDRIIRTDWDAGFKEGRQYGRGKSGGQVKNVIIVNLKFIVPMGTGVSCHLDQNCNILSYKNLLL